MSNWITHTVIADKILDLGLNADKKGFVVGNIAPDCNIENPDWTKFTPSREFTHFMSEKHNKLTIDFEKFYDCFINGKAFDNDEHYAFLLGYYSHLITDREYQKFIRNEQRVKASFERIKKIDEMRIAIEGYPENFDTLKKVFGKGKIFGDMEHLEHVYLQNNPQASYNTVLRKTTEFADYLDFLPHGAIKRKIDIMAYEPPDIITAAPLVFFSDDEYMNFLSDTSRIIYEKKTEHIK